MSTPAWLAEQHLDEALQALRTHARRAEHEHGLDVLQLALRAAERAVAVLRELLA